MVLLLAGITVWSQLSLNLLSEGGEFGLGGS